MIVCRKLSSVAHLCYRLGRIPRDMHPLCPTVFNCSLAVFQKSSVLAVGLWASPLALRISIPFLCNSGFPFILIQAAISIVFIRRNVRYRCETSRPAGHLGRCPFDS